MHTCLTSRSYGPSWTDAGEHVELWSGASPIVMTRAGQTFVDVYKHIVYICVGRRWRPHLDSNVIYMMKIQLSNK